ncbi:MAG: hypothetical protein GEV07_12765 [Streptosporangiales bacterium]|nr:hypothetical protein [Streptosporangiales bacterium]
MSTPDEPSQNGSDPTAVPTEAEANALEAAQTSLGELTTLMTDVKTYADARYDAMGDQLAELAARVDGLENGQGGGDSGGGGDGGLDPAKFQPWSARATAQDWYELINWVDWMQQAYSLSGQTYDPVPPCWPAHQNVVEELAALQASWKAAMVDDVDGAGASDASLYWHDRWLYPTRERLSNCFLERCRIGQHELPKPPLRTKPDYLPAGVLPDAEA